MASQWSAITARSAGSVTPATASAASGEAAVGGFGVGGVGGIELLGDARQAIKQAATSKVRIAAVVPCRLPRVQVHLIDGTYELFRQWFGAPQAQHQGREVGAVRSMIRSFAML